jgi:hypothetical protein
MNAPLHRRLVFAIANANAAMVVAWAAEALASGLDSKSLRILAGLGDSEGSEEVWRYLQQASREIGFELPSETRRIELAAGYVAGDIVSGAVSPQAGCANIYALYLAGNYLPSLADWCGLDDMLSLASEGTFGTVPDAEQDILAEAKKMLAGAPALIR